jgi:hypothetical protein
MFLVDTENALYERNATDVSWYPETYTGKQIMLSFHTVGTVYFRIGISKLIRYEVILFPFEK